jgi:acyl-coenzyme A synthetase/AMP-(fatty) acid ligase
VLRLGPNHFLKHHYEKKIKLKNELALLLPTSGSTGSSKLVRISYSNLIENARSIVKYLNINKDDVAISSLPMHYSFGLSIINSHLLMGAKIVMTDKSIMEKDFWELVKTHKVTSLSGVPYSFEMLKRLRFFTMQLPHLRMLTQAGGKLDNKLQLQFAEYCKENNKEFFVMYGQTEATARMSYLPSEMAIEKIGSIGIPIPGGEFVLINEHGEIINQPNVPGELVYRGPNVSMGYAESVEDLSKGDENIGVLYTGDIVYRDEDGYYFIVGRKNRFLKLFGNRVSLDEVEQHLKELGIESVCAGVDDKLIVYTTQDYQEKEIKENLAKLTSIHFSAFKVVHIDEIPRNSAGKIIYAQLPIE